MTAWTCGRPHCKQQTWRLLSNGEIQKLARKVKMTRHYVVMSQPRHIVIHTSNAWGMCPVFTAPSIIQLTLIMNRPSQATAEYCSSYCSRPSWYNLHYPNICIELCKGRRGSDKSFSGPQSILVSASYLTSTRCLNTVVSVVDIQGVPGPNEILTSAAEFDSAFSNLWQCGEVKCKTSATIVRSLPRPAMTIVDVRLVSLLPARESAYMSFVVFRLSGGNVST
jgi:hypothetical protein